MLTGLSIRNFRGIKEGKLDNIGEVNILLGPNNSGKSTILESIYLASSAVSHSDILGRNRKEYLSKRRVSRSYIFVDSLWYKYRVNTPITFILEVDKKMEFLFETYKKSNTAYTYLRIRPRNYYSRFDAHSNWILHAVTDKGPEFAHVTSVTSENICTKHKIQKNIFDELINLLETSVIIDSFISNKFELIEEKLWFKITTERTDKRIVEIINSCYDSKIESFSYFKVGPGYSLAALLPTYSVRIDEIGDGARMAVAILALAFMTKNGILLFEEPENHQHIRALDKIMRALFEVSKMQKTQIFISTHSLELTERIVNLSIDLDLDLTLYGLTLEKGKLSVRAIKKQDAKNLLEVGEDLRII